MEKKVNKIITCIAIIIAVVTCIGCTIVSTLTTKESVLENKNSIAENKKHIIETKSTTSKNEENISKIISSITTNQNEYSKGSGNFRICNIGIQIGRMQVMIENYYKEEKITKEVFEKYIELIHEYEDENSWASLINLYNFMEEIIENQQL
jgi:hypothetical protein